jgi:hypothetical protein
MQLKILSTFRKLGTLSHKKCDEHANEAPRCRFGRASRFAITRVKCARRDALSTAQRYFCGAKGDYLALPHQLDSGNLEDCCNSQKYSLFDRSPPRFLSLFLAAVFDLVLSLPIAKPDRQFR